MSEAARVPVDSAPPRGRPRCPYCHQALRRLEPVSQCARCATPVHTECGQQHGRCVTLGCAGTLVRLAAHPRARQELRYAEPPARRLDRALRAARAEAWEQVDQATRGAPLVLAALLGLLALGWVAAVGG